MDDDRLAGLARTKLHGLVSRAFTIGDAQAETFAAGAGLLHEGAAYVYVASADRSPLAAAMAWAGARDATSINLILDDPDPVLSMQALGFDPAPTLWRAVGTELEEILHVPPVVVPDPPDHALAHSAMLRAHGCELAIEHGVMVGEILGLEVARAVIEADGSASLRIGVGLYDQDAHALIHAKSSLDERLAAVVEEVSRYRTKDAGQHPINRVARQRWLRSVLIDNPAELGDPRLEPGALTALAPLRPRGGIYEDGPASAVATVDGATVLVVCSFGIDIELVPEAAGQLAAVGADEVILALPERDHHAVIERQAGLLRVPARLVAVDTPWR